MQDDIFYTLTNRLIASDEEAFDRLFRLLYAPLVKFSWKYTRDKASASDIVQDAFIKLWQIREDLEENESVKAYLFRMVRNLSLNHLRDRSYETNGLETERLAEQENHRSSEPDRHLKARRLELVKQWIKELPQRQRQVLEMSRFEGLNHAEIAEVLNLSERTVNNHIVAAMKKMKKFHDEYMTTNR